jgi:hypothetical protein
MSEADILHTAVWLLSITAWVALYRLVGLFFGDD